MLALAVGPGWWLVVLAVGTVLVLASGTGCWYWLLVLAVGTGCWCCGWIFLAKIWTLRTFFLLKARLACPVPTLLVLC